MGPIKVEWKGESEFEAIPPSGNRFSMDSLPESGGHGKGPTPLEAFIAAGAACSAMDVIHILEKKRLKVAAYHVEVDSIRSPEGELPRPFVSLVFRHVVVGDDIDAGAVEQAVRLSDEKYCTAIATLRGAPTVTSEFEVRTA